MTSQPLAILRHRVRAAEGPAMTEPPWWLTIDVTVIVTSAILIGIAFWIGVLWWSHFFALSRAVAQRGS
jgi:predicted Abi (CAAX) family protease